MQAPKVTILCDSCCDLPKRLLDERGIRWIPFTVTMGGHILRDGIDTESKQFFERLQQESGTPSTSQVTPPQYADFFRKALDGGGEAVYIGFSSGLSGSLQNARLVAVNPEFAGRVHVVDSLGASGGLGLMVLKAHELAAAGLSAAAVAAELERYKGLVCHVFTLDTLEYIRRGGRVSAFQAVAANLLDIKPVLDMDMEGKLIPIDRVRGRKRSLSRLLAEMETLGLDLAGKRAAISHAACEAEARELAEQVKAKFGVSEVLITEIGPVIGAHTGPGCIALFFEGKPGRE